MKANPSTFLRLCLIATALLSTSAFADAVDSSSAYDSFYNPSSPMVQDPANATSDFSWENVKLSDVKVQMPTGQVVAPGLMVENLPQAGKTGTESHNTVPTATAPRPEPVNTVEAENQRPPQGRTPTTGQQQPQPTTSTVSDTEIFEEASRCFNDAQAALKSCESGVREAEIQRENFNRTRSSLSDRTAVACQQLATTAKDAAASVMGWGNSCKSDVDACTSSCGLWTRMKSRIRENDKNRTAFEQSYNRCRTLQSRPAEIQRLASDTGGLASNMSNCYNGLGGTGNNQPNLNTPPQNNQLSPAQQQAMQQQLNCAVNPRGCGQQQTEPFAPTNLQPAAAPRDAGNDRLPTVAGPGNVSVPFDGSALLKDEGRPRSRGTDTPRAGGGKANVASDFTRHNDPPKPKRYVSPAEKVGAEVYRGYMSPGGGEAAGAPKVAAAEIKPFQPIKPALGSKIAPPVTLSKFQGQAAQLRQIWSQKMRDNSGYQRGIAGSEYRGFVPTGADGVTGPHTENFKKIRGRFMYLERSFNQ